MTENAQLLDVLYAAGDALSVLLLLIGASVLIEAVFEAGRRRRQTGLGARTHQAQHPAPARRPDAASVLPQAQGNRN